MPQLWSAEDGDSSEAEVMEFVAGLVRVLKPLVVVETGCYLGRMTLKMGMALKKNGIGKLYSCDTRRDRAEAAMDLVKSMRIPAEVFHQKGVEMVGELRNVGLAFIDSGSREERIEEIEALDLARNGLVLVHDFQGFKYRVPALSLPTPRGLAIYTRESLGK